MLKLAGSLVVIVACTALGMRMSADLYARTRSLRELERAADLLKAEIQYAGTPLPEAFSELAKRCAPPFAQMFGGTADRLGQKDGATLSAILEEGMRALPAGCGLTKGDRERFAKMGGRLGYLDVGLQLRIIEQYKEELARQQKEADEEYGQKAKTCRCLGFLGGVFLTLLFL